MSHYIIIPEDYPKAQQLQTATEKLLKCLTAGTIYYSFDFLPKGKEVLITILIDKEHWQLDRELLPVASSVFQNYPEFGFELFSCDYAEDALRKGNLYFLQHCTLGKFAYSNCEIGHPVYPDEAIVMLSVRRAIKLFKRSTEKINSILFDFSKCLDYENLTEAFYILHRALELLFKQAAILLKGKALVSKSIALQQDNLRQHAPEMASLFDPANATEQELLTMLDDNYWNYKRKKKLPGVPKREARTVVEKVQRMQQFVKKRFETATANCEKILRKENADGRSANDCRVANEEDTKEEIKERAAAEHNSVTKKNETDKAIIVRIITSLAETYAIYSIAYHNLFFASQGIGSLETRQDASHYYLLVFVKAIPNNGQADIAYSISQETEGRCKATLLIHTMKSARGDKAGQRYFFQNAINGGTLFFENRNGKFPFDIAIKTERNADKLRKYWQNRTCIALALLEAEFTIDNDNVDELKVSMLHQAVEQLCLGLIFVFLGYRPNHFALGYLFDLCDLFTPLASDFFPRKAKEEAAIFKELGRHASQLRHSSLRFQYGNNTMLLERRCKSFYKSAVQLGEEEMERIDKLSN